MKISWAWIVLALVAGWGVGFFSISRLSQQQLKASQAMSELRMKNRIEALEVELAKARGGKTQWVREKVPTVDPSALSLDPVEILNSLIHVNELAFAEEKHRQWRILFYLEHLVEIGEKAVPAIHTFLQRNEDVVFHSGKVSAARSSAVSRSGLQPVFPNSLRSGLIEVLERIGGEIAEASLVEMLQVTGRGIEIALAAQTLESMVPGKYTQEVLTAARELLNEPLRGGDGIGIDVETRAYLFRLLNEWGDDSYLEEAKTQLILEYGKLDRNALAYVMENEGADAMESVFNAFQNTEVLDLADRLALAQRGLEFVGIHEKANEMLHSLMSDPQLPNTIKVAIAEGMSKGNHLVLANPPSSPEEIKTRMQILETIRIDVQDAQVRESIMKASDQLQLMLDEIPANP